MDAAGYDPVIIETVGTGQSEIAIMRIAQTVLVTLAPGMGDDIQAIKAGILEIADIFVVSKADKPGADQTAAELSMLLSLDPKRRQAPWRIPILKTSSYKEQGIVELIDKVQKHYAYLRESNQLKQRMQRQVRSEIQHLILQAVTKALEQSITAQEWEQLIQDVSSRQRDPYSVASELEKRLGLHIPATNISDTDRDPVHDPT